MKCPYCNTENSMLNKCCEHCGKPLNNEENSYSQSQQPQNQNPQYQQQPQYQNQYPNQYQQSHPQNTLFMVLGILELLFCCLAGGIAALVENNAANKAYKMGNIEEYERKAKNAKLFLIISPIIGIVFSVVYVLCTRM